MNPGKVQEPQNPIQNAPENTNQVPPIPDQLPQNPAQNEDKAPSNPEQVQEPAKPANQNPDLAPQNPDVAAPVGQDGIIQGQVEVPSLVRSDPSSPDQHPMFNDSTKDEEGLDDQDNGDFVRVGEDGQPLNEEEIGDNEREGDDNAKALDYEVNPLGGAAKDHVR